MSDPFLTDTAAKRKTGFIAIGLVVVAIALVCYFIFSSGSPLVPEGHTETTTVTESVNGTTVDAADGTKKFFHNDETKDVKNSENSSNMDKK
jgi:hypothetical protein